VVKTIKVEYIKFEKKTAECQQNWITLVENPNKILTYKLQGTDEY